MTRLGIAVAAAVLSLALVPDASGQATLPRYVFTTVDAVASEGYRLRITGIQEGQATASEVTLYYSYSVAYALASCEACERKALLAMNKPGQYVFEAAYLGTLLSNPTCKLTRVNP